MSYPPGTLLAQRYEIRELVGVDGPLEMYRALDLRLGRDVALTLLEVHDLLGTEEFLRFEREAQARAAIHHPRITTIHDFGHDTTRIFLVAQWMEGESLRARLKRGGLSWPQVRALGQDLLDGLGEIHSKGFALGSLTTASVFLEQDGRAKLFAYRLQKMGTGDSEASLDSGDLGSLADLLVATLPPEAARAGGAEGRMLERLRAFAQAPGQRQTGKAMLEILREKAPNPWKRRLPWIAALVLVAAGGLAVPLLRRPKPQPRVLIALLPFQNLGGGPEAEYLGPNLLHALANELGRTPGLRVALAGSIQAAPQDPAALARQMGADLALTGGYQLQGGRLLVETRLLRARDGSIFSHCQVERSMTELLFLTTELEDQLRASLQARSWSGGPAGAPPQCSRDAEAQRLCLQGLQLLGNLDQGGFEKALGCFQSAIARDSAFALAHSGLSDCYCALGCKGRLPKKEAQRLAQASALKALELDPGLAQAHAALGNVRFRFGLDWMGAEEEFRQAIRLDPSYAQAHQWFGLFLATLGHWEESLEHMRRALELEPLSMACRTNYALDLHWAGRSQEALQEFDKILDQTPGCLEALSTLMQIQEELGTLQEALVTCRKIVLLGGLPEKSALTLQDALEAQGPRGYWDQRVHQAEQWKALDPLRLAEFVALQGDKPRAFRLLDRAILEESPFLVYLPKNPAFESLRPDPRFLQLLRRMGYPST